jgi:hypothetical protein
MRRWEIVRVAFDTPERIEGMLLADGVEPKLGKLSQSLIKPPQLQF